MEEDIENLRREVEELKADVRRLGEEVHRLKIGVQPPRDSEFTRYKEVRRRYDEAY